MSTRDGGSLLRNIETFATTTVAGSSGGRAHLCRKVPNDGVTTATPYSYQGPTPVEGALQDHESSESEPPETCRKVSSTMGSTTSAVTHCDCTSIIEVIVDQFGTHADLVRVCREGQGLQDKGLKVTSISYIV